MFKTDPICILTAGHTVDGREVKPETLREMAETYDPKTYNARINLEHSQYGYKLGSVLGLAAKEIDGHTKLFAELKPNYFMLSIIQQGQKLHTSAEIVHNFAQTGKAYLTGLALTDTPACLGTTEMHLSANGSKGELLSTENFEPQVEKPFFTNPFSKKGEDTMSEATLEALKQLGEQNAQVLTALNEVVNKLSATPEEPAAEDYDANIGPGSADAEATTESVDLSALQETVVALNETVNSLKTELKTVLEETDEQFRHQATGETESSEAEVL